MVRFGKKHGQIWQKVVLVSTMFSKTMLNAKSSKTYVSKRVGSSRLCIKTSLDEAKVRSLDKSDV